MVKKAVPPTVTVKPGYYKGVSGYVVRVAGEAVGVYSGESGYREARRHMDKVLADWKQAQRGEVVPNYIKQGAAADAARGDLAARAKDLL